MGKKRNPTGQHLQQQQPQIKHMNENSQAKPPPAAIEIKGIKCDAPGCDYHQDDEPVNEGFREWLNRPCPKCGANLLTQADLDATERMLKYVSAVNKALSPITEHAGLKRFKIALGMDGSGKINPGPAQPE
jgi:hypothetical protein